MPVATPTPQATREPPPLSLAEPGPYYAGNTEYTLVDSSRDGREIELRIWYPAIEQNDADDRPIVRDAIPDMREAPYPVILTENDSGRYIFLSHLSTYGFVLVVVKSPLGQEKEEFLWIDLVRDFLFALDHISKDPPEGLESVMDTDRVGVTGYSYGGDIALALSGARVNPAFYRSQCGRMPSLVPKSLQWVYTKWVCRDYSKWEDFVAEVGVEITTTEDGLWQPITDERIRAVMPMAPTLSWYYGERGLAAVDRPILLLWGTKDSLSPYQLEAGYTFERIGNPQRYLISLVDRDHMLPFNLESASRLKHFTTAFFGHYLQGRDDYAAYFSEDFIAQFDDIDWGVYPDE
jgi:predicted dienelactone hydrolase